MTEVVVFESARECVQQMLMHMPDTRFDEWLNARLRFHVQRAREAHRGTCDGNVTNPLVCAEAVARTAFECLFNFQFTSGVGVREGSG